MTEDTDVHECAVKAYIFGAEYGASEAILSFMADFEFMMSEEDFSGMVKKIKDRADAYIRFSLIKEGLDIEDMKVN